MRFKSRSKSSQMPEINLVPMMDVVMTILTFFIVVSMTLTNQKTLNVDLPSVGQGGQGDSTASKLANPLIVGLDVAGKTSIDNQILSDQELTLKIQSYLTNNPQGQVVLTVDKKVSYEQLVRLLSKMQQVGGERVSLAIEDQG